MWVQYFCLSLAARLVEVSNSTKITRYIIVMCLLRVLGAYSVSSGDVLLVNTLEEKVQYNKTSFRQTHVLNQSAPVPQAFAFLRLLL